MSGPELLVIGSVIGAIGTVAQGAAVAKAEKFNARVAEANAAAARDAASADAERQRREARRRLGEARAQFGASGVTLEGSPLDVLEDSAAEAELDALLLKHRGDVQAVAFENEAMLARSRAKQARSSAFVSAAGLLAGGVGQAGGFSAFSTPAASDASLGFGSGLGSTFT